MPGCTAPVLLLRLEMMFFVERDSGSRPRSVQLHGTCRIDSESLCVTRPSVQRNCCRPGELEMHRKWWHKWCINAPTEIQGENEGKQHVGASWGQMAVLSLWDNVGMGDKICSDDNSWYVIRISFLDSHYATKKTVLIDSYEALYIFLVNCLY